ncbi:hypothetical protein CBM2589_B200098 [Cupriavidus taiwanensis]|uniref:Uncharacterized protein n=1 Tax=Cupriavidus taiwanensis TaxID=164546 RepID=A0A975WYM8_9BURK|nr:hypothetical protein CBM2589_B200098 [Cupriavidus taiwanensis]
MGRGRAAAPHAAYPDRVLIDSCPQAAAVAWLLALQPGNRMQRFAYDAAPVRGVVVSGRLFSWAMRHNTPACAPRRQGPAPARGLAKGPFRMSRRPGGPGLWGRFVDSYRY